MDHLDLEQGLISHPKGHFLSQSVLQSIHFRTPSALSALYYTLLHGTQIVHLTHLDIGPFGSDKIQFRHTMKDSEVIKLQCYLVPL